MIKPALQTLIACAVALAPLPVAASESCATDAMLVFDGSGSMAEMGFNLLDAPRIVEAREAVRRAMPFIAPVRRVGLIIYGPGGTGGPDGACNNVDLRFPPLPDAGDRIRSEIDALQPLGETPLTDAVRSAAEQLDYRNKPGLIVLVTDGKETCGGAPCHLAGQLAAEGYDLTVHVIGFRVRDDHFSWDQVGKSGPRTTVAECLPAANGGRYVPAESVEELAQALEDTLGCQHLSHRQTPQRKAG
ncbi:VWA domain-containing protein [Aliishimia ponticola]|uniref:VWA domain-containing protein n=1 Tax=Aliishimia ponticola TaxID=2499833 RepID=A0A4S4NEK4_9RHOB|nr:vWA domain-containing protein [Aliishimia ponticola]THH36987.1 VWA domain-containing protein [Aliishimia ponticola]